MSIRKKSEMIRTPMVPLPMPKKLHFNITPEIKSNIEEAKKNMNMWESLDLCSFLIKIVIHGQVWIPEIF